MPENWINLYIDGAELYGIFDSLKLIQDRRYAGVMIQTDNLEAIKAIQESSLTNSSSTLIRRIHYLLER
ncbi:hypothetical protein Gogos_003029, partial [Gossypium gossypioides]|nr:hypothetical protein [Gossypium gossypioides]